MSTGAGIAVAAAVGGAAALAQFGFHGMALFSLVIALLIITLE